MATNTHFNHKVKSEQNLYEDIIIESLQMFGQDVMYLPRHVITKDDILNEDYAKFENAYSIEMYIENTEGWGGEGDLMSKFGLQIRDQATFIVSKSRWEKILFSENQIRPFEGDLIYMPLSNAMFEISHVEHELPFYALGNLPTYQLHCNLFEYASEEFNTSVPAIDQFESLHANYDVFGIEKSIAQLFTVGEIVTQATDTVDVTVIGEVSKEVPFTSTTSNIYITNSHGSDGKGREFQVSSTYPIVGEKSSSSALIVSDASSLSNPNTEESNVDSNISFDRNADSIIDFSESNPFGEP